MAWDEAHFHRQRGLGRWERIGHPLDTLSFGACFLWLNFRQPVEENLWPYVALSAFSCVFITKDEFVHKQLCNGMEHWLHAVLFVLHPVVLTSAGFLWWFGIGQDMLRVQLGLITTFFLYQAIYWGPWNRKSTRAAEP